MSEDFGKWLGKNKKMVLWKTHSLNGSKSKHIADIDPIWKNAVSVRALGERALEEFLDDLQDLCSSISPELWDVIQDRLREGAIEEINEVLVEADAWGGLNPCIHKHPLWVWAVACLGKAEVGKRLCVGGRE